MSRPSLLGSAAINTLFGSSDSVKQQHFTAAAAVGIGAAGLTLLTNATGPMGGNTFSYGVGIDYSVP